MLASELIASSRYDLRDGNITQWTDPELLDYLNRNVRVLQTALASVKSDWSKKHVDVSLLSGNNYVDVPTDFMTPRNLWDGTDEIYKESIDNVEYYQRESLTGSPSYYAVKQDEIIFDKTATETVDLRLEYNFKNEDLLLTSDLPYNDDFNDDLREGVIIIAKNRNERLATPSLGLMKMYSQAAQARVISRNHTKKRYRLDF